MGNARKRERYDNKNGSKEKEEPRERIWSQSILKQYEWEYFKHRKSRKSVQRRKLKRNVYERKGKLLDFKWKQFLRLTQRVA